jgi:hypothetical protein
MISVRRKRFSNGVILGFLPGEWWIGVRRDWGSEMLCFGLLGFMLLVPLETFHRAGRR